MSAHINELAELYALGSLDDLERRQVDAHVRNCPECAARLGQAEETVSTMILETEEPSAQLDRRVIARFRNVTVPQARFLYPVAAALLLVALVPWAIYGLQYRDAVAFQMQQAAAEHAMVNSHFVHAPFVALTVDAPRAKLISARDRSWFYILADTNNALGVAVQTNGTPKNLGSLSVSNGEGSLFVSKASRGTLLLLDGTRPVARARL